MPCFLGGAKKYLTDDERSLMISFLAQFPESGNVIPGSGGLRKLRWRQSGQGKRGGVRVIYYFYNNTAPLVLLDLYSKHDKEDLDKSELKMLSKLANELKLSYRRGVK
ncbi:MAG: addiction module toxin RelE [Legionellaceae bacterium]|nr:addiction module toxin RelE [Legionellaceae bacterium]